jgi:VanZ family protein
MQGNVASTPHLRVMGSVVTFASLAVIALATLLPASRQPVASHFCIVCGTLGGVDSILNVLLFVPLGVGLALYGVPAKRAILMLSVLSILIETAQLLVIPGRDATIGDVLTNSLGGALGFAGSRHARAWLSPSPRNAVWFLVGWAAVWLTIQATSSFAFAPSLPVSQYYGQLAPSLGDLAVFQGHVLTARVGGVAIPNNALADSRSVQRLLLHGATVGTTVISAEPTRDIAPIVRVADAEQREMLILAQNDVDLLFSIRFGAAALRVRPPLFVLPEVFPSAGLAEDPSTADTIALSGQYVPHEVRMSAQTGAATSVSIVPLTASLGWTLVLPWQWFIEGSRAEHLVSWIWVACLIVPYGYWAACTRHPRNRDVAWPSVLVWPAGVAMLCGGLAVAPYAFGLSATPISEWAAAVAGLLLGRGLATRTAARTALGKNTMIKFR